MIDHRYFETSGIDPREVFDGILKGDTYWTVNDQRSSGSDDLIEASGAFEAAREYAILHQSDDSVFSLLESGECPEHWEISPVSAEDVAAYLLSKIEAVGKSHFDVCSEAESLGLYAQEDDEDNGRTWIAVLYPQADGTDKAGDWIGEIQSDGPDGAVEIILY